MPVVRARFDRQKTQVMAAIQDVTQNGMSAMSKYQDDPEILAVIEDLKSVF